MSKAKQIPLSKSRYINGLQCPKMLWFSDNRPDLYDESVMNEKLLGEGNKVGELARQYFKADATVEFVPKKSVMLEETKELLKQKKAVIAEASFLYDGNFCRVDILQVFDGYVEMVEVKGSTQLKDVYLDDVAYQYYVLSGDGLTVKKASLMHLNNQYTRAGDLNLDELFTIEDCTDTVREMQKSTAENIERIRQSQLAEPQLDIGPHCGDPYECGFIDYCWKHIPENSVFNIARFNGDKKFECYQNGIITFEQVINSNIHLSDKQTLQVKSETEKLPPTIDRAEIRSFLDTLNYPLYFLDFETCMMAIPPYDGMRPYMQIPFQYSLHILARKGGTLEHREFLAKEGTDPRRPLAEKLCQDIPGGACVIAYNMAFEKRIIAELAEFFPDLSGHLTQMHDSFKDIMKPFMSQAYYRREFAGSYSIKTILPVLYPDDKELDYSNLELIHDGGEAMDTFPTLHEKPPEEIAKIRKALLDYCRLDTLGMVKILQFLEKKAKK